MNLSKIIFLFLSFIFIDVHSQTFNERITFSNAANPDGKSCFETIDHYIFFSSYIDTSDLIRSGAILLDHQGNFVEESIIYNDSISLILGYYGSTDQFANGFVSCGNYHQTPFSPLRGQILMFDNLGDTVWTRLYQEFEDEEIYLYKALKVEDGVMAIGQSYVEGHAAAGLMLKYDNDGNFVWRQDYLPTTSTSLILVSAVAIPSGGFLLGGASQAPGNWDHMIIKTDNEGNQIWRKYQGDEFNNYYAMVCNTATGQYIFGGVESNSSGNESASQVTRMNVNGSFAWTETYGDYGPDCGVFAIKQMPDGGFVFCGSDRSSGSLFGYICRIDFAGNQLWYRKYQQMEDNWSYLSDVVHTSDNGFLLTGLLSPMGDIPQAAWALKLDSLGCLVPGCEVGIIEEGENAGMRIYPNPADDFINVFVESKNVHDCELHLYDMQGKEIYCTTVRESGNTFMMDSASLSSGIYLLNLELDGEVVKSEKVVVRH